jgi:hypothetical protein
MADPNVCATCKGDKAACICRSTLDLPVPVDLAWSLTKAWDEGFSAGVKATQADPYAFPAENPYRQDDLHGDCLCERCRPERRRRLGDEAAIVEEARILETARTIFASSVKPVALTDKRS